MQRYRNGHGRQLGLPVIGHALAGIGSIPHLSFLSRGAPMTIDDSLLVALVVAKRVRAPPALFKGEAGGIIELYGVVLAEAGHFFSFLAVSLFFNYTISKTISEP